jgi:hypothetical protein
VAYHAVSFIDTRDFNTSIANLIEKGYQPHGRVKVNTGPGQVFGPYYRLTQMMVKYDMKAMEHSSREPEVIDFVKVRGPLTAQENSK